MGTLKNSLSMTNKGRENSRKRFFVLFDLKALTVRNSLLVQWLRLHTPNAEGLGSIPGQGTRSHMPQLRVRMLQLKIPQLKISCATTKDPTCCN